MTALLTSLLGPKFETYLELGAALVLVIAIGFFVHHERAVGAAKVQAADAKAVAAQVVSNQKVEDEAQELAAKSVAAYKAALAAKPSSSAPVVRVCVNPRGSSPVRQDAGPGSVDHAAAQQPAVVAPAGETDIGPVVDQRFAQVDAQLKALQTYVAACQKAGICQR